MNFDKKRFDRISHDFENWWGHELERPIMQVTLSGDASKEHSRTSVLNACYNLEMDENGVMEEMERFFDSSFYYGDAFPLFYMRSTGILGIYMNQKYQIDRGRGVIHLEKKPNSSIEDLTLSLDTNNGMFVRTSSLMREFQERFVGNAALGIADLGGVFDILSSLRGTQELMLDMFDCPEKVKEAAYKIHEEYKKAYDIQMSLIDADTNPGYTSWATMLSKKKYYITQCDFSFMIGTDMFDEFYKPILELECEYIERAFYHLDGPGQVKHLDSILEIDSLKGVQWISGAGAPKLDNWPEIYKKINASGKLTQVFIFDVEELQYIDYIVDLIGTSKGLCFICFGDVKDKDEYFKYLDKYGVPFE